MLKVAVLDDYQNVFDQIIDTQKFKNKYEFKVFNEVFLDEKDELVCQSNGIPYGRKQIVKNVDEELIEYFGDKSMIIFQ